MTHRIVTGVVTACIVVLMAGSARCQPKWGVEAHGGWSQLAMGDVNDSLSSLDRQIGTRFEPVDDGASWGLALRRWVSPNVLLRLGFERLSTASENSGVRFAVADNSFMVGATWWNSGASGVRYGLGAALGPQVGSGRLKFDRGSFHLSGTGFGGAVTAEAMIPVSRGCSLTAATGYRLARTGRLRFDNSTSGLVADFSGPFVRIGLAIDGEPGNSGPSFSALRHTARR